MDYSLSGPFAVYPENDWSPNPVSTMFIFWILVFQQKWFKTTGFQLNTQSTIELFFDSLP